MISYCEFMNSWLAANVPMPRVDRASAISRTTPPCARYSSMIMLRVMPLKL